MSEKDGGPAFPFPDSQGPGPHALLGMTLRDYFAAKALQAELITTCSDATPAAAEAAVRAATQKGRTIAEHLAINAYAWADAMLKARSG